MENVIFHKLLGQTYIHTLRSIETAHASGQFENKIKNKYLAQIEQ